MLLALNVSFIDGTIDIHRARVVAQDFTNLSGFEYSHTFSPAIRASTVCINLSLAVMHIWSLH